MILWRLGRSPAAKLVGGCEIMADREIWLLLVILKDRRCFGRWKEWWENGRRHRSDGPALIRWDGSREFWIRGERVSEGQHRWLRASCDYWT